MRKCTLERGKLRGIVYIFNKAFKLNTSMLNDLCVQKKVTHRTRLTIISVRHQWGKKERRYFFQKRPRHLTNVSIRDSKKKFVPPGHGGTYSTAPPEYWLKLYVPLQNPESRHHPNCLWKSEYSASLGLAIFCPTTLGKLRHIYRVSLQSPEGDEPEQEGQVSFLLCPRWASQSIMWA